jgi:uncharacterized membrane protein
MHNPNHSHQDPNLRASDADREQVAEILRNQHAEGRLDTEELQRRIDACYESKTAGDLDALLRDLPRREPSPDSAPAGWQDELLSIFWIGRRRMLRLWPVLIGLIAVAVVTGHFFWFAIPLFFLAARVMSPRYRRPRGVTGGRWA